MLERFRQTLQRRAITDIELAQADVLQLDMLPASWRGYDLIVSASMMEYLPRHRLVDALAGLRGRLSDQGSLVLFITRRNWLMRQLIGRWWQSNLYTGPELREAFRSASFSIITFEKFPARFAHFGLWGHIVVARPG